MKIIKEAKTVKMWVFLWFWKKHWLILIMALIGENLFIFNFDLQNIILYSATPIIKQNAKSNIIHNYLGLYLGCLVNGK